MSEIKRLIRVAQRRNSANEYVAVGARLLGTLNDRFRKRLAEDRISFPVFLEAVVRGYVSHHPAVLAMIDQWMRDEKVDRPVEAKSPKFSSRELDEIYAATGSGMVDEEE